MRWEEGEFNPCPEYRKVARIGKKIKKKCFWLVDNKKPFATIRIGIGEFTAIIFPPVSKLARFSTLKAAMDFVENPKGGSQRN